MTHIERLKKENPGMDEKALNHRIHGPCPPPYEKTSCPLSAYSDCEKCWNLEEEEKDNVEQESNTNESKG